MARVQEILRRKNAVLRTISPAASVHTAIETMVQNGIGSLVVMDADSMVGIFTERDVLKRVALSGMPTRMTAVRQVMTRDVVTIGPDASIEDCMERMSQRRIRHLPVEQSGKVVAMISIGDLVQHCLSEREVEVRHLTDYIAGRYS